MHEIKNGGTAGKAVPPKLGMLEMFLHPCGQGTDFGMKPKRLFSGGGGTA